MSRGKKFVVALVGILISCGVLAGCGVSPAESAASLSKVNQLASSGIVTKEQLKTIEGKSGTYSFAGQSGDVSYKWEYDAAQIKNPTDQHLKIAIEKSGANVESVKQAADKAPYAVSLKIAKFELAGSPKLSIELPEKWQANHAVVLTQQDGKIHQISDAHPQISTDKQSTTVVSTVTVTNKTVYIVGGWSDAARASTSDGLQNSGSDSSQNGDTKANEKTSDGSSSVGSTAVGSGGDAGGSASGKTSSTDSISVTMSIDTLTLMNNLSSVVANKRAYVPSNGWILPATTVKIDKGESVYDVLVSVTKSKHIQMESRWTPMYGSYYVSGINQLYEFDGGSLSGWMYNVDGWYPNYGASSYNSLHDGSTIQWRYTQDLGHDLGTNVAGE